MDGGRLHEVGAHEHLQQVLLYRPFKSWYTDFFRCAVLKKSVVELVCEGSDEHAIHSQEQDTAALFKPPQQRKVQELRFTLYYPNLF